jgi:hypothetical protein
LSEHVVPALQQSAVMQSLQATIGLVNPQVPLPPVPPPTGGAVQGIPSAVEVQPPEIGGRSSEQPNDQLETATATIGARHTSHRPIR